MQFGRCGAPRYASRTHRDVAGTGKPRWAMRDLERFAEEKASFFPRRRGKTRRLFCARLTTGASGATAPPTQRYSERLPRQYSAVEACVIGQAQQLKRDGRRKQMKQRRNPSNTLAEYNAA